MHPQIRFPSLICEDGPYRPTRTAMSATGRPSHRGSIVVTRPVGIINVLPAKHALSARCQAARGGDTARRFDGQPIDPERDWDHGENEKKKGGNEKVLDSGCAAVTICINFVQES